MYTAKERETLLIETAHFLYLGCFYGSERFVFHCRRIGGVSQNSSYPG
jgi:hypothetical protein